MAKLDRHLRKLLEDIRPYLIGSDIITVQDAWQNNWVQVNRDYPDGEDSLLDMFHKAVNKENDHELIPTGEGDASALEILKRLDNVLANRETPSEGLDTQREQE